jgi:p-hydroxybenzoate 3-monooxygenase
VTSTQVGIVGAGPAGLMLGHLLHRAGVESVTIEQRSRAYVEARVRAGVLEHGTTELMKATGVGDRLVREGLVHHGVNLQFHGVRTRIALSDLTGGKAITVYGQQEVVKDLIARRLGDGGDIVFDANDVSVDAIESERPVVRCMQDGQAVELRCDIIAGCDGFHGICRPAIPDHVLRVYERSYPFGWLGVLADVRPSTDELIYSFHDRGFAMHSLRTPEISRLYLQVDPADDIDHWPDERIWAELQTRLSSPGWTLDEGPVIEKAITPMRGFVVEPMQCGRLFLAGDAAHIVPPTGAKGLNLAIADVRILADAITEWYTSGADERLDSYSATCLRRVWRVQEFSAMMTNLMHRHDDRDPFINRLQRAQQDYLRSSHALQQSVAENYVGLEMHDA